MMSPKCNDWCPCDRRRGHREATRGGHVKMEAEIGVTQLYTDDSQHPPEARKKQGRLSPRDTSGRTALPEP